MEMNYSRDLCIEKYQYILLTIFLLIYAFSCFSLISLRTALHGDEYHFFKTIVQFSKNLSLSRIKSYNELITPLTFILYGLWSKTFGTDLHSLRLFSVVIGFLTNYFMFFLLKRFFGKQKILLLALYFLWLLNPYIVGFNAYVYTDGLSNLLIIIFFLAIQRKNYGLIFIASALLLFTRQYNLILILAAAGAAVFYGLKTKIDFRMLTALLLGTMCIVPLFLLWGGTSPPGPMSAKLHGTPRQLYFNALPVYMYCISFYTLPLSLIVLVFIKKNIRLFTIIFIVTALYYVKFPAEASLIAVKDGFYTVGLCDKLLSELLPYSLKNVLLFILFVIGNYILSIYINDVLIKNKKNITLEEYFMVFYVLIFVITMIVNFQIWEKYFTQIFPVVLIMIGKIYSTSIPELSNNLQRFRRFKP